MKKSPSNALIAPMDRPRTTTFRVRVLASLFVRVLAKDSDARPGAADRKIILGVYSTQATEGFFLRQAAKGKVMKGIRRFNV